MMLEQNKTIITQIGDGIAEAFKVLWQSIVKGSQNLESNGLIVI